MVRGKGQFKVPVPSAVVVIIITNYNLQDGIEKLNKHDEFKESFPVENNGNNSSNTRRVFCSVKVSFGRRRHTADQVIIRITSIQYTHNHSHSVCMLRTTLYSR